MKIVGISIIAALAATIDSSFPATAFYATRTSTSSKSAQTVSQPQLTAKVQSRGDFISISTATVAAITSAALVANPIPPAYARGRATLEQACDRYTPRIIEGGAFYKSQLYGAIAKKDWKSIESATAEPPKRTREDLTLQDGGIAKRAALAGGFSEARVLTAMDLFASTFSESSISPKTKAMKKEVEKLREVVQGLNKAARILTGEEKATSGLFGMQGKAPSQVELIKEVTELYFKGGNAYNQYVYIANEGLPVQIDKLPFL